MGVSPEPDQLRAGGLAGELPREAGCETEQHAARALGAPWRAPPVGGREVQDATLRRGRS